ncbi:MAG: hypothetical protein QM621_14655 [Aeromicrobium sp.]
MVASIPSFLALLFGIAVGVPAEVIWFNVTLTIFALFLGAIGEWLGL